MYDSCCSHGKFVEDKFNNFPLTLKGLLCMNTSFHENIRNANSAFAFGSMKTEIVNFPSGPQCFKVHGPPRPASNPECSVHTLPRGELLIQDHFCTIEKVL